MAKRSDHGAGGKFAPGNQAARKRKAKHTGSRTRLALALDAKVEKWAPDLLDEIRARAINDSDFESLKYLLDRVWPKRRGGPPITISLPRIATAEDVVEAMARIVEAVARGELTAEEGQSMMALVDRSREAIATATLAAEMEQLRAAVAEMRKGADDADDA